MKRRHLSVLARGLELAGGLRESTAKFSCMVSRNAAVASGELEHLRAILKPADDWLRAEAGREDILKRLADKDDRGAPVVERDAMGREIYKLSGEARAEFEKAMAAHMEANKAAYDARRRAEDGYNAMMDEECPPEVMALFRRIKVSELPAGILPSEVAPWDPFIED